MTLLGEDSWMLPTWSLPNPALCASSLCWFSPVSFHCNKLHGEYNGFLNSTSPLSESLGDLGDLLNYTQIGILCCMKFALSLKMFANNPNPFLPQPQSTMKSPLVGSEMLQMDVLDVFTAPPWGEVVAGFWYKCFFPPLLVNVTLTQSVLHCCFCGQP